MNISIIKSHYILKVPRDTAGNTMQQNALYQKTFERVELKSTISSNVWSELLRKNLQCTAKNLQDDPTKGGKTFQWRV